MEYEDTTVTEEQLDETTEYENTTEILNTHQRLLRDFDKESFDIYLNTFRTDNPTEEQIFSANYPEPFPINYIQEWKYV